MMVQGLVDYLCTTYLPTRARSDDGMVMMMLLVAGCAFCAVRSIYLLPDESLDAPRPLSESAQPIMASVLHYQESPQ